MKKYKVTFECHDPMCRDEKWSKQYGFFKARSVEDAIKKCKDFYGLNFELGSEYRILSADIIL